jgi:hypothetical protein
MFGSGYIKGLILKSLKKMVESGTNRTNPIVN